MGIMDIAIYPLFYWNLFVTYDINKFVFIKIDIDNVFVYLNELYFFSRDKWIGGIVVANDIFSIDVRVDVIFECKKIRHFMMHYLLCYLFLLKAYQIGF